MRRFFEAVARALRSPRALAVALATATAPAANCFTGENARITASGLVVDRLSCAPPAAS